MNGYRGKMLIVDLIKKRYEERELTPEMAEHFIGGYGIGARVLFDMMEPGVDPLGPKNIIGFTTGPLTATGALLSGRYTVVCKSPVTGGWNDANSGGYFGPGFARTYATDPTPGRHVKGGLGLRHMQTPDESKYNTNSTGEEDLKATMVTEINNTAGLCMFQDLIGVENLARKFLTAVTGRSFGAEEEQKTGLRIFNMRHAFNLREGLKPAEILLPKRCVGEPPQTEGPLKGITVSYMSLIKNFFRVMEWDETTGRPSRTSLEKLGGLDNVITSLKL